MRSVTISENLKLVVPVNIFERISKVEKAKLLKKYIESIIKLFVEENSKSIEVCANALLLSGILEEMMKSNKNLSETIQKSISLMDNIIANYKMTIEDFDYEKQKLSDEKVKELFGILEVEDGNIIVILKNISFDFELALRLHGILELAEKITNDKKIKILLEKNSEIDYFIISLEKILSIIIVRAIEEDITIAQALKYFNEKYLKNELLEYLLS